MCGCAASREGIAGNMPMHLYTTCASPNNLKQSSMFASFHKMTFFFFFPFQDGCKGSRRNISINKFKLNKEQTEKEEVRAEGQ